MLRIIHKNEVLPFSWRIDPAVEFQPVQIAQQTTFGNQIVMTVKQKDKICLE